MKAQLALIGGDAMQRTVLACKLRRRGLSVFAELADRKRTKAFNRAVEEADHILDLDNDTDQAEICWLLNPATPPAIHPLPKPQPML